MTVDDFGLKWIDMPKRVVDWSKTDDAIRDAWQQVTFVVEKQYSAELKIIFSASDVDRCFADMITSKDPQYIRVTVLLSPSNILAFAYHSTDLRFHEAVISQPSRYAPVESALIRAMIRNPNDSGQRARTLVRNALVIYEDDIDRPPIDRDTPDEFEEILLKWRDDPIVRDRPPFLQIEKKTFFSLPMSLRKQQSAIAERGPLSWSLVTRGPSSTSTTIPNKDRNMNLPTWIGDAPDPIDPSTSLWRVKQDVLDADKRHLAKLRREIVITMEGRSYYWPSLEAFLTAIAKVIPQIGDLPNRAELRYAAAQLVEMVMVDPDSDDD